MKLIFTNQPPAAFQPEAPIDISKILAVLGATGNQGGSVINFVLKDPELSHLDKIRATARDTNSEKARQLKEKVEVVKGSVLNRASLEIAMTTPSLGLDGLEVEYNSLATNGLLGSASINQTPDAAIDGNSQA